MVALIDIKLDPIGAAGQTPDAIGATAVGVGTYRRAPITGAKLVGSDINPFQPGGAVGAGDPTANTALSILRWGKGTLIPGSD